MTNEQINYCAESLVDSNEFYMLRPEDLDLCFKLVLSGRYGGFYDRLDQPMVFEFIRKYALERHETILEQNKKTQHSNIYEVFQTEPMQKILNEVTDKLSIKERKNEPKPERKPDVGQIILSEFDDLCKAMQLPNSPIRVTMYKEKMVDLDGYMKVRIVEMMDELETNENE